MSSARKVLVVPKQQSGTKLQHLRLPHSSTGMLASFYADIQTETILEAATVDMKGKRSWLGDGWVIGDGSASLLTPIDPLFIHLGLLTKFTSAGEDKWKFVDISALALETHEQMDAASLGMFLAMKGALSLALETLCEVKEISADTQMVRIDSEKVLGWLRRKCDPARFPESLKPMIPKDMADEAAQRAKSREMALLVAEYLPEYWTKKVFDEFSVHDRECGLEQRVKAVAFDSPDSYALGVATPSMVALKVEKPKTAKEKQLEKAAKKSKPITSFFQKKT
ncbi:hypothetical protein GGI15_000283 [Coemansia interrupta]|uniref:Uncharacterized protein n=1 Tax=Coemansia interrupta TaxID=1126814 RepID=A0A9W8HM88_9FUNG|nr:hypothetical protein GGI15_000283 [Coemansia interrupta]